MADPRDNEDQPVQPSEEALEAAAELTADVSPDAQESVQEFMAEAAQQNVAATEALASGDGSSNSGKPGPVNSASRV